MSPQWRLDSWNRYRRAHKAENCKHVLAYRRRLRESVYDRDGWRCVYCGHAKADGAVLTIDHKVPLSRGGKDTNRNKATCCQPCNQRKFTKTHAEYLRVLEAERLTRDRDALPSFVTAENPLAEEDAEMELVG